VNITHANERLTAATTTRTSVEKEYCVRSIACTVCWFAAPAAETWSVDSGFRRIYVEPQKQRRCCCTRYMPLGDPYETAFNNAICGIVVGR
jgi:hypothetical protein